MCDGSCGRFKRGRYDCGEYDSQGSLAQFPPVRSERMRRRRMRRIDLVILGILFFVVIVFEEWIKPGPWFLPSALFMLLGVIAVYIVAYRAQPRMNELRRDLE